MQCCSDFTYLSYPGVCPHYPFALQLPPGKTPGGLKESPWPISFVLPTSLRTIPEVNNWLAIVA
jgi:hypothetical protein